MKPFCASILFLLVSYNIAAQTLLPTQPRAVSDEGSKLEHEKSPYEGRQIRSLEFRGNQNFSSGTIRNFLKVKEGDGYSHSRFEEDMYRLRVLLLGRRGYLKATVGEPQIEDSLNGLEIVVPIQEGVAYRLGEIKVEDATLFSPEEIIQIVGLKSGEIVDGYGFLQGLSELERLYRDRGCFQSSAGFVPEYKQPSPSADEGIVDITLQVEEGEVFQINTIQFVGNSKTTDQALRRRLLIHEGDTYSESLLQESLSRLNALGLFEKLTIKHAAMHINGDTGRLDITIRLTEKPRETDR
jgi:outer membrane protein insertion porin family